MHGQPANKNTMAPLYETSTFVPGNQTGLGLLPNILLRIFRSNIAPHAGNEDEIRGALVNLLVYAHKVHLKEEKRPVDVMNFIYEEIYECIHARKSPPYAPYVMILLISKGGVTRSEGTTEHKLGYIQKKPTSTQLHRRPAPYPGATAPRRTCGSTSQADPAAASSSRETDTSKPSKWERLRMWMCIDMRKTSHVQYKELHEIKTKLNSLLPPDKQTNIRARKTLNQWNEESLTDWGAAEDLLRSLDAEDAAAAASAAGGADEEIQSEEEADASDEEENQYDDEDYEDDDDDEEEEEESE